MPAGRAPLTGLPHTAALSTQGGCELGPARHPWTGAQCHLQPPSLINLSVLPRLCRPGGRCPFSALHAFLHSHTSPHSPACPSLRRSVTHSGFASCPLLWARQRCGVLASERGEPGLPRFQAKPQGHPPHYSLAVLGIPRAPTPRHSLPVLRPSLIHPPPSLAGRQKSLPGQGETPSERDRVAISEPLVTRRSPGSAFKSASGQD